MEFCVGLPSRRGLFLRCDGHLATRVLSSTFLRVILPQQKLYCPKAVKVISQQDLQVPQHP